MPYKILVIEDDPEIANLLDFHLKGAGYVVTLAGDGDVGLQLALSNDYDLIILDLILPGTDGLDISKRVRARSLYTPIVMLTCKSSEVDRILGLELGADYYVTKPFSLRELLSMIKALFRRIEALKSMSGEDGPATIKRGDLQINVARRTVTLNEKDVYLTAKEFDLLLEFAQHPGRVYTRSQLLNLVWGYGYEGYEHTVNSHINRLRAKIEEDHTRPRFILTLWGVGYKFSDELG